MFHCDSVNSFWQRQFAHTSFLLALAHLLASQTLDTLLMHCWSLQVHNTRWAYAVPKASVNMLLHHALLRTTAVFFS